MSAWVAVGFLAVGFVVLASIVLLAWNAPCMDEDLVDDSDDDDNGLGI